MTDEQREAGSVLTTKDLLLELRSDVKQIKSFVDVLSAANLPSRVDSLESSRDRSAGRNAAIAATVAFVISALGIAIKLHPI